MPGHGGLLVLLALLTMVASRLAEPLQTYNICLSPALKKLLAYPVETYLDFDQQANTNGYLSEKHYVTTEDGYILTIFRMKDPKCTSYHKVPVLLMHGIFTNSDLFLIAGEDVALGYLLAKSCFDVWAGNFRGNNYARNHTTLNPDKDATFWDFSIDEMAYYDNPAMIDYITETISSPKINFIGYSLGGGSLILSLADHPQYNSKIGVFIALGPALIVKNLKSVPFRIIFQASYTLQDFFAEIGIREVLFKGSMLQTALEMMCNFRAMRPVCATLTSAFDSHNPGSLAKDIYARVYSKLFMGQSVKLGAGYQQWIDSGLVRKYDYGSEKNVIVYESRNPPVYNFSNVKAPAVLIAGLNDGAVRWDNVQELGRLLPNLIETVTVNDTNWNHVDLVLSQKIPQLMYPIIEKYLLKYDIN